VTQNQVDTLLVELTQELNPEKYSLVMKLDPIFELSVSVKVLKIKKYCANIGTKVYKNLKNQR